MVWMIYIMYDILFSDVLILKIFLHVQDSLVALSSILSCSVFLVDGGREWTKYQTSVGDSEASSTLFL